MPRLRQLIVKDLSLVLGKFSPVNRESKALIFKSEKEDTSMPPKIAALLESITGLLKAESEPEAKPAAKPAAESAADGALAKATVKEISTYQSKSETVRSSDESSTGQVQMAAKTAPADDPVAKAVGESEARIVSGVGEVLKPVVTAINGLQSRVITLEKATSPSQRITVGEPLSKAAKFPDFTRYLEQTYGLTPGEKLSKAAITTGSFTYGLTVEEADRFIDHIVDLSVLLKKIRVEKLNANQTKVDKIGLGTKVLKKQTQGTDPGETVSVSTSQIIFNPKDIIAVVRITDNALADNIEGDAFMQHLLDMVGRAAANELEEAAMMADDGVADTYILDIWDGFYTRAIAGGSGAHIIDATGDTDRYWPGTDQAKATRLLKALPHKFRQDPALLAWIQNPDIYLDYLDTLAGRETGLGDQSVTGRLDVPLRGIQNIRMPLLPTNLTVAAETNGTFIMLTLLANLIIGFRKYITIESQRLPRLSATDWVMTFRADVNVEEMDAVAIYKNAKVQ